MPPNGWNCRCEVVQVIPDKYDTSDSKTSIALGEKATSGKGARFRFNPGKDERIFPPRHGYNIDKCKACKKKNGVSLRAEVPDNELCAACEVVREMKEAKNKLIKERFKEFERLKRDPDYTGVVFDQENGGLMATHKEHNFNPQKGWYEKTVQQVGYRNGNSVVFGDESSESIGKRHTEGTWNGKPFEIAGAESGTANNIRNALKHCASKRETEVAVLFFPNGNFDFAELQEGFRKYNGLKRSKGSQYKSFGLVVCVGREGVLFIKNGTATIQ